MQCSKTLLESYYTQLLFCNVIALFLNVIKQKDVNSENRKVNLQKRKDILFKRMSKKVPVFAYYTYLNEVRVSK